MTVAIVADSAAALPESLAAQHDITIVPLQLTVDGRPVLDAELPLETILASHDVETSGPSPGDFAKAIADRMTDDGVLVLTLAETMSSTHESAAVAARTSIGPVEVVDTQTAAGAEALVVLAAARAAARGDSLDEVVRETKRVITSVRLVATVPSLEHLARSGRVPAAAEKVGRRLRVAPLFEFRGGAVKSHRPAFGVAAAYDRMVRLVVRGKTDGGRLHVAAYHALAPDAAHELLERVEQEVGTETSFIGEFGAAMVVHTGPGLVGLAWWWDDAAPGA